MPVAAQQLLLPKAFPVPTAPPAEAAAAGARNRCRPCSAGVNGRDGSASEARAAESVECSEPPLRRWCGSMRAAGAAASSAVPSRCSLSKSRRRGKVPPSSRAWSGGGGGAPPPPWGEVRRWCDSSGVGRSYLLRRSHRAIMTRPWRVESTPACPPRLDDSEPVCLSAGSVRTGKQSPPPWRSRSSSERKRRSGVPLYSPARTRPTLHRGGRPFGRQSSAHRVSTVDDRRVAREQISMSPIAPAAIRKRVPPLADEGGGHAGVDFLVSESRAAPTSLHAPWLQLVFKI